MEKEDKNLRRILDGKEPKKNLQFGGYKAKKKGPTIAGHKPGDKWEENGKTWIMTENGTVQNETKMDDYRMPWFCPECKQVMNGSKDRTTYYVHGTCLNCLVDYHEKLRKLGKLDQFAFRKRLLSAISWYEEQEREFDEFIEQISENPEFAYSDGRTEKWDNQMDVDKIAEEYKEFLEDYRKKLDNSIEKYENRYGEKLDEWEEPE